MYKFNKIEQFANIVKEVQHNNSIFVGLDDKGKQIYDHSKEYPTLTFIGTVKLHGTNAAIVKEGGVVSLQSRSRIIKVGDDNAGFAAWVEQLPKEALDSIPDNTVIYGEWCGGNIQKGVALNGLPKMFVVFMIKDLTTCLKVSPYPTSASVKELGIYSTADFATSMIKIDFNNPHLVQERLQKITEAVENECPVGKQLGVSGIGEGVVWATEDFKYRFKVKGEKHLTSKVKVKVLAAVDVEKLNSVSEFCDNVVTINSLNQGLDVMREQGKEIDNKIFKDFIKWVIADIREEEVLLIEASNLTMRDVGKSIGARAAKFLQQELNKV